MAWSVDRLGRSLQDLVGFLAELHALKIDLCLKQQGIDTTTPAGKALYLRQVRDHPAARRRWSGAQPADSLHAVRIVQFDRSVKGRLSWRPRRQGRAARGRPYTPHPRPPSGQRRAPFATLVSTALPVPNCSTL